MSLARLRLSLIFFLLAPLALARRVRRRPTGWVDGGEAG
jgi:hypothetical protein